MANSRVKFFNPPNKSFSANSSGGQVAAVEDRSGAEAVNGLCDRFRGLVDHEHRLGSVVSVRLSKTWCALADTDSHLSCLLSLGGNQVSSVFSSTTALPGPKSRAVARRSPPPRSPVTRLGRQDFRATRTRVKAGSQGPDRRAKLPEPLQCPSRRWPTGTLEPVF